MKPVASMPHRGPDAAIARVRSLGSSEELSKSFLLALDLVDAKARTSAPATATPPTASDDASRSRTRTRRATGSHVDGLSSSERATATDANGAPVEAVGTFARADDAESAIEVRHPEFGVLRLSLLEDRDGIDLCIRAPSALAASALRKNAEALRSRLRAQGITLRSIRIYQDEHELSDEPIENTRPTARDEET